VASEAVNSSRSGIYYAAGRVIGRRRSPSYVVVRSEEEVSFVISSCIRIVSGVYLSVVPVSMAPPAEAVAYGGVTYISWRPPVRSSFTLA
jgi:hypothetical protein